MRRRRRSRSRWRTHTSTGASDGCSPADSRVLARDRGYEAFVATILPDNRAALALMRELVPDATVHFTSGAYEAHLRL